MRKRILSMLLALTVCAAALPAGSGKAFVLGNDEERQREVLQEECPWK